MAKLIGKGVTEFVSMMGKLDVETSNICKNVVYDMAGVVADEVHNSIERLDTVEDTDGYFTKLSVTQKQGLIDGLGIAKIETSNGETNTKVGFNGYNKLVSSRFPKGQPNVFIARLCESGKSNFHKQPFVRPALKSAEEKATEKGKETFSKKIDEITK